ncbi:MAG: Holliday junction resolvase RuvX [Chloroflexota bacterium]
MSNTPATRRQPYPGRAMGIDLGEKRIGIAVSDQTRLIASAHSVMKRKSRAEDFERFARFIAEQQITLIVMGLPITLAGHEGDRAAWVRDYTADLCNHIDVPVVYWDESLSTKQAEASLRAQGKRGRKIREHVDAVAAAVILQSYLDADRPPLEQPDDFE